MVVTFLPAAADSGVTQERTAAPSRCTVQAPHWAMPQPNFVPVMRSESRSTHKRGVSGAAATSRVVPLTVREAMKTPSGKTVGYAAESYSGGPWKSIVAKRRDSGGECAAGAQGPGCTALGERSGIYSSIYSIK